MAIDRPKGVERRQHPRIRKNYIVRFCEKNNPALKFDVSQVENISQGGMCFTSTIPFKAGADMVIELRTPYIADTILLEGQILDSTERVRGLIYANRLKFGPIDARSKDVLGKIEEYNGRKS